jgi:hypothetical protein
VFNGLALTASHGEVISEYSAGVAQFMVLSLHLNELNKEKYDQPQSGPFSLSIFELECYQLRSKEITHSAGIQGDP